MPFRVPQAHLNSCGNRPLRFPDPRMKKDRYKNFAELVAAEPNGVAYRVTARMRKSDVLIAAPHAGRTELHTAAIAKAIASTVHSLYIFKALAQGLHITSSRFDEPHAIEMARRHPTVLAVHGCDSSRSPTTDVFVGGLDGDFLQRVLANLIRVGFRAAIDTHTPGKHQANICNRGSSGVGVQLEITRRLRNRLCDSAAGGISLSLRRFARAVRSALE